MTCNTIQRAKSFSSPIAIITSRLLLVFFILAAIAQLGHAVPAYPHPVEITQPDGTKITVYIRGDESLRWHETVDGYTLLRNQKGFLEYAVKNTENNLTPSGIQAKEITKRTLQEKSLLATTPKQLTYSPSQVSDMRVVKKVYESEQQKAFPTTGNRKLICILIGFKDLAFTKTQSDFNNLFNQIGYNTDSAKGSVKDYYKENSYNQFDLTVTVAGPYTADNNMAYYGANNASGDDVKPRELVTEAINKADSHVNYADFDNDGDGNVDGLYVIYAGYGEEAGGPENAIWAHAWFITPIIKDGKTISAYSCSSELRGNKDSNITRIGVICHEFGHTLGAPDYYDTNYGTGGQYNGTGQWDLMAGGSWNDDGSRPAHHNVFTKWRYYNWLTPVELISPGTYNLSKIENNKEAYYFRTTTAGEYYIMENRQKSGFDTSIPGHGLMIYHVDSVRISTAVNSLNATHPQLMYPVCANANMNPSNGANTYGDINSPSCPFPGLSNKKEFSDGSLPGAISWAGNLTNKPLTQITETNGIISFTFNDPLLPKNFKPTVASDNQINLTWNLNGSGHPVLIAVSTTGVFGSPANGVSYSAGQSIPDGGTVIYAGTNTSVSHTNLNNGTTYYYKIWSNNSGTYSTGLSQNAQTPLGLITSFPWHEGFEHNGMMPVGWTQVEIAGSGVFWTFVQGNGGTNPASAHTGNYNACFRDQTIGDNRTNLITPAMDISSLSDATLNFWFTQKEWVLDQDTLAVLYRTSATGSWTLLKKFTTSVDVWTEETLSLPNGTNDYYICFRGNAKYGYGICVDDVMVTGTPLVPKTENITASIGSITTCFNATDTILVAGSGNTVLFPPGSDVELIAGMSIRFLPGFYAQEGCTMNARITTDNSFCNSGSSGVVAAIPTSKSETLKPGERINPEIKDAPMAIKAYPNPGNGVFTLELTNTVGLSKITVANTMGAIVHNSENISGTTIPLDLSKHKSGLYILRVHNGNSEKTVKLMIR